MTERYAKLGRAHITRTGNTAKVIWSMLIWEANDPQQPECGWQERSAAFADAILMHSLATAWRTQSKLHEFYLQNASEEILTGNGETGSVFTERFLSDLSNVL